MKQILCFGDSNTYGYIPANGKRYPFGVRWTSVLAKKLGFDDYNVIEEGLCGRTTIFEDPIRDGRCGVKLLPTILETHSPIDLTIIMLGTNDCKTINGANAEIIAKGISRLIKQVRTFAKSSEILVISPIHLGENVKSCDAEFCDNSVGISKNLAAAYRKIAEEEGTFFLDASTVAEPCEDDNEHLNEKGHKALAEAVYAVITEEIFA